MLFAVLMAFLAPQDGPKEAELRGAKLVEYGQMPSAGSGVFIIFRRVDVVTADGTRRALYFVHGDAKAEAYLGRGSGRYPALGSICDIAYTNNILANLQNFELPEGGHGDVIEAISCRPA